MADPETPEADEAGGGPSATLVGQTAPGIPDDSASPGYDPVADTQAAHDEEDGEAGPGPDTLFNGP